MHISFPSQRGEDSGFWELQQTFCELNCHSPLPLGVAPVQLNMYFEIFQLNACIKKSERGNFLIQRHGFYERIINSK